MATIHHATAKQAASKGVILTSTEDEVTAHRPEPNRRVVLPFDPEEHESLTDRAKDAWVALDDILAYEAEHPATRIGQDEGDFVAYQSASDGGSPIEEICRDPDLADLFESLADPEVNGQEVEDDEEPEDRGSVVPAKYKAEYAARGNPNHCGDWLAETLATLCRVLDEHGKEITDIDRLEAIANANDVAPARYGKLGMASNGWQGRFRMTIRNMLVPRVAAKGFLFVPEGHGTDSDREFKAPAAWCLSHSPKPKEAAGKAAPKAKAKAAKKPKLDGIKAASDAVRASKAKEAARKGGK